MKTEVIIVGGGRAGRLVAEACKQAGLAVIVVDESLERPGAEYGRGFIAGPAKVAVLDARTGDETQLLECLAIVVAIGCSNDAPNTSFLGLGKLGVERDARGAICVDQNGRSSVPSIFAAGSCSTDSTAEPARIAATIAALLDQTAAAGSNR